MAQHVQLELQKSTFDILRKDRLLMDYVQNRIYDNVPDNAKLPFIVFGDEVYRDWGAHDIDGFQGEFTIHAFDDSNSGRKKIKDIQNRIYTLIHPHILTVDNHAEVNLRWESSEINLDPGDLRTYHGLMRFSFIFGGNNG